MYQFKELSGLTRAATIATWFYATAQLLLGLSEALDLGAGTIGLTSILNTVGFLVAAAVFGCWVYRASANAHVIADGLSISPGWSIGWYFVPIMSLFQPYVAMKEIWLASNFGGNWGDAQVTRLLPFWWGTWLMAGFIAWGTVLARPDVALVGELALVTALFSLVATFCLTRIMAQVREGQRVMRHAEVFA
jgi:hypothetical protein